jgi:hypothetical protein
MQTQAQKYEDLCRVTIEVPAPEDILKAMKWLLAKEEMERELDIDASIKITFYVISRCSDTQCYHSFDSFGVERVERAEAVGYVRNVDERSWEKVVVVIPKKFAGATVVLRHENELGTHYHVIYRSAAAEGTVNGWKEVIVPAKD